MMAAQDRPRAHLAQHWIVGAVYTGAVLALLTPLVHLGWGRSVMLIHLCGVAYIAHQIEEHWGDRFRRFVNDRVFGGVEALTRNAVWWINLPGVWGVNIAALYSAVVWGGGAGLAAPYLMLVNALGHGAAAIRFGYNPGLATSLALFAPIGGLAVATIPASVGEHSIGLGIAIVIHLAIIGFVLPRLRRPVAV